MSYLLHSDIHMPKKFKRISIKLLKEYAPFITSHHVNEYIELAEHVRYDVLKRSCIDYKHDYTSQELMDAIKYIIKNSVEPFEVEITRKGNRNLVTKYVCRGFVKSRQKDLVVVFRPKKNKTTLIATAWWNSTNDNHKTLDYSKYLSESQSKQLLGE